MSARDADLFSTHGSRIAAILRQRILTATPGYEPGQRLLPGAIAAELGVSVTPVREALQLLAADHLVDLSPHRSVRVVQVSPAELEDLMRVLSALQTLAVRFKNGRLAPDSITRLSQCLDACEDALKRHDVDAYRVHDADFHTQIAIASGSPQLANLYEYLKNQAAILEIYFPHQPELMAESLAEHRALLRQLANGDPARSEEAMEEHNRQSQRRARLAYRELPGVDGQVQPQSAD